MIHYSIVMFDNLGQLNELIIIHNSKLGFLNVHAAEFTKFISRLMVVSRETKKKQQYASYLQVAHSYHSKICRCCKPP